MKYATLMRDGIPFVAAIDDARGIFWPLSDLDAGIRSDADMVAVIEHLCSRSSDVRLKPQGPGHSLRNVKLRAPILAPPRNIFCVGKNYREHAKEFQDSGYDRGAAAEEEVPEVPIIFTKPWTSISDPDQDIALLPGLDEAVDYEAELAIVIGKPGRGIPKEAATSHVFGYTILNDLTARDLQRAHKQWYLGKALDGFAPMGPWIVEARDVNVREMHLRCTVNGELRQDAYVSELIFDIPTLIATISKGMQLLPGDIIATGTPKGVGIGFRPPKFLKDGDIVEIDISGIGFLRNTVRRARDV